MNEGRPDGRVPALVLPVHGPGDPGRHAFLNVHASVKVAVQRRQEEGGVVVGVRQVHFGVVVLDENLHDRLVPLERRLGQRRGPALVHLVHLSPLGDDERGGLGMPKQRSVVQRRTSRLLVRQGYQRVILVEQGLEAEEITARRRHVHGREAVRVDMAQVAAQPPQPPQHARRPGLRHQVRVVAPLRGNEVRVKVRLDHGVLQERQHVVQVRRQLRRRLLHGRHRPQVLQL
mmetsp:Transcript_35301/g.99493  ORF Transcript_35301/g.99493 Transcript_35301/m.99493 type:complete len:231 (+) Transcript_35301:612-1304(+)